MPCVYFIRKGEQDVYKVGMSSNDAKSRLGSLQTGNEEPLTLCATIDCPSAHTAEQVEKYLHQSLAKYRLHGEWFRISWLDVQSVLRYYQDRNYKVESLHVRARSQARFIAGYEGRVKDRDAVLLKRALERVAALEKANAELLDGRMARVRNEIRAEYFPEIKIVERELELRDREIARLKKEIDKLHRPSIWQRFKQLFNNPQSA